MESLRTVPGSPAAGEAGQVVELPVAALAPDPVQPRKDFRERSIRELAASIEQHGLLQPLLVRPMLGPDSRGRYWIVAGERRYRAALMLGLETLPCRIQPYVNLSAAVVALADNVHREDLGELEKAEALLRIKTLTDRTWDQVAELVKLSRDYVKRLAGLLKLEDEVKEKVRSGAIPARTAIALKPLPPRKQIEMAERVVREGLTAEEIRQEARRTLRPRLTRPATAVPIFSLDSLQVDGAASNGREGLVVKALQQCSAAVHQIDGWLESRSWAPSKTTAPQEKALEELYQCVALLQQHLLTVRNNARRPEESEAEKLRRAAPLLF
jgi:ParB family chromosome partitioning protein